MSTHRRYSEAFWLELLQQFEQSGQSVQAFCAEVGVSPSGSRSWKKRHADRSMNAASFIPLSMDSEEPASQDWSFELRVTLPGLWLQLRKSA